jgi:hypothetical protein
MKSTLCLQFFCLYLFALCLSTFAQGEHGNPQKLLPNEPEQNMILINALSLIHPRGINLAYQRSLTARLAFGAELGFGMPERRNFLDTRLYPERDLVAVSEKIFTGLLFGRFFFSGWEKQSWYAELFVLYYYDSITVSNGDCGGCVATVERRGSAIMSGIGGGPGFGYSIAVDNLRILLGLGVAIAPQSIVNYEVRDLTTGAVSDRMLTIGPTAYGFSTRVMAGFGLVF